MLFFLCKAVQKCIFFYVRQGALADVVVRHRPRVRIFLGGGEKDMRRQVLRSGIFIVFVRLS